MRINYNIIYWVCYVDYFFKGLSWRVIFALAYIKSNCIVCILMFWAKLLICFWCLLIISFTVIKHLYCRMKFNILVSIFNKKIFLDTIIFVDIIFCKITCRSTMNSLFINMQLMGCLFWKLKNPMPNNFFLLKTLS